MGNWERKCYRKLPVDDRSQKAVVRRPVQGVRGPRASRESRQGAAQTPPRETLKFNQDLQDQDVHVLELAVVVMNPWGPVRDEAVCLTFQLLTHKMMAVTTGNNWYNDTCLSVRSCEGVFYPVVDM
mmetsp:Transcript_47948/g.71412  ORF Transcript_47948/g.71412 Transcript_47948/m.71412 type:complete len:126 (+) Transcript_47948:206-583(+)